MRRALAAAVLVLAGLSAATPAQADITRIVGPTVLLSESRMFVRYDVAFDTTNRVYLMVWGTQLAGPVNGMFLSESGTPIGSVFAISTGTVQSGWARVIHSAEQGKFLVSYTKIKGSGAHEKLARFVTYSSGNPSLGAEIWLDAWNGGAGNESGLAYATATGRFFVTWDYLVGGASSRIATIDANGNVLNTKTLTNPADGQTDAEIACDPVNRRCFVVGWSWGVLSGGHTALWGRFIDDTTGDPQGSNSFYLPAGGYLEQPTVTHSAEAGGFIVAYTSSGQVYGNVVNGATDAIGAAYGVMVSNGLTVPYDGGGYGFSTVTYNSRSNTSAIAAVPWSGLPAVQELDSNGYPIGAREFVPNGGGAGRPDPWEYKSKYVIPAANTAANEFLVIDNHLFQAFRLSRFSAGPSCNFTLPSSGATYTASSGGQTMTLTASDSSCEWTAASNASWLTLTSAASGAGNASVSYTVAANPTIFARSGIVTIAGRTFTVNQAGIPCTFSVDSAGMPATAAGLSGTLSVTTITGCPWSAGSSHAAITFPNGNGRNSSGTVNFTVAPNYSTIPRTIVTSVAGQSFTVAQTGIPVDAARQARENARTDFNADGYADILWQDSSAGYLAAWTLSNGHAKSAAYLNPSAVDLDWRIAGTGDFNGDGKPDIVWRNRRNGQLYLWYMNGVHRIGHTFFSIDGISDTRWNIVGIGDFNGDTKPDIVWQHDTAGWLVVWMMDNATLIRGVEMTPERVDIQWKVVGVADINADGQDDLIWWNSNNGSVGAWLMSGTARSSYVAFDPGIVDDLNWRIAAVIDINGDQTPDLVWHHLTRGWVAVWYLNGNIRIDTYMFPYAVETNWRVVAPK